MLVASMYVWTKLLSCCRLKDKVYMPLLLLWRVYLTAKNSGKALYWMSESRYISSSAFKFTASCYLWCYGTPAGISATLYTCIEFLKTYSYPIVPCHHTPGWYQDYADKNKFIFKKVVFFTNDNDIFWNYIWIGWHVVQPGNLVMNRTFSLLVWMYLPYAIDE